MAFKSRWDAAFERTFRDLDKPPSASLAKQDVFFVALADPQFGLMNQDKHWKEEQERSERAVVLINSLKPDFVIICGDLVNHMVELYPGTDESIRGREIDSFKETYSKIDSSIALLCVCGNHDVGNTPTTNTISNYKKDFGDDYFSFYIKGVKGIVLNSNLLYDPSGAIDEYEKQNVWLQNELASVDHTKTRVIVFMHHPLFLKTAEESDDSEDIGTTNFNNTLGEAVSIPNAYFHIPLERRLECLVLLHRHNVEWVFSGHWHQCGEVASQTVKVNQVITGAVGFSLGKDQPGLRLVLVKKGVVSHKYYDLDSCPTQLPTQALSAFSRSKIL